MPVTDIHAHILPEGLLERLGEAGLSSRPALKPVGDNEVLLEFANGKKHGPIPLSLVDVELRLQDMDAQGVDVQLLGAVPMLFAYGEPVDVGRQVSELTNDSMLGVAAQHPDRFGVMASLPMQDAASAVAEIERLVPNEQVRGVQIGTNVAGENLDDPALEPVWDALERAGLPALLHPAPPGSGGPRMSSYHLGNLIGHPVDSAVAVASLVFGGVLQRHPGLRIGLVHGGGYWPYQTGRWDHGFAVRKETKVNIQSPPSEFYGQLFADTLTHDGPALRFLGERVGWDHVLVGTDYPFDMAETDPVARVKDLSLDTGDETAVLERNADSFLRGG